MQVATAKCTLQQGSNRTFMELKLRNVVKEEVCKAVGKRPFLTQAKAYDIYGRKNVERWKREGKVKDFARGRNGKITRHEYKVSELEACACQVQDYLCPK